MSRLKKFPYRFLAPVLSAQFMTAPTGQAKEILNLAPAAPPRPLLDILADETSEKANTFNLQRHGWEKTNHSTKLEHFSLC